MTSVHVALKEPTLLTIKRIDYFIERVASKSKNGSVKVIVDFWRIIDGQRESLNGEARDDTNKEIRKFLGQYDDFILTALSLQNNNTGFIDMKQSSRKDLLSKFLDIGVFEDLYQIANSEIREVAVLLKKLKKEDFSTKLSDNETEYKETEKELRKLYEEQKIYNLGFRDDGTKMTEDERLDEIQNIRIKIIAAQRELTNKLELKDQEENPNPLFK